MVMSKLSTSSIVLSSKSDYNEQHGKIYNNHWLGLWRMKVLSNFKDLVLKVDYIIESTLHRVVVEYVKFKVSGNTYIMTFTERRFIRSYPNFEDIMLKSNNKEFQKFGDSFWWGEHADDSVPLDQSGIYWGKDKIKNLKMSVRNYVMCEEIIGHYSDYLVIAFEMSMFQGRVYQDNGLYRHVPISIVSRKTGKCQMTIKFPGKDGILFIYEEESCSLIAQAPIPMRLSKRCDTKKIQYTLLSNEKPARMSTSYYSDYPASQAFDGNVIQHFQNGFGCPTTHKEDKNWIQVDLEASAVISSVKIYNRNDCCLEDLQNAYIYVSKRNDMHNNKLCKYFEKIITTNQIEDFDCERHLLGRYVRLEMHREAHLRVCEMQVFGYFTKGY